MPWDALDQLVTSLETWEPDMSVSGREDVGVLCAKTGLHDVLRSVATKLRVDGRYGLADQLENEWTAFAEDVGKRETFHFSRALNDAYDKHNGPNADRPGHAVTPCDGAGPATVGLRDYYMHVSKTRLIETLKAIMAVGDDGGNAGASPVNTGDALKGLTDKELSILYECSGNPGVGRTARQLSERTGIKQGTVQDALGRMVDCGLLQKVGTRAGYAITDTGLDWLKKYEDRTR